MTIAELMEKMIAFSNGERQDIDHFIRVWTFARTIAEGEGLDAQTQFILEAAAITHDIACPLCREKYGYTNGKYQEREGAPMARRFLEGSGLSSEQIERIVWLVGHHHSYAEIVGEDHQILLEADFLANAAEKGYGFKKREFFQDRFMKTASGVRLLCALFPSESVK